MDFLFKLPEICPVCGTNIEKGYMYFSGPGIYWGRKKQLFPKLELITGKRWAWFRSIIEAGICRYCKSVLFYGERIRPTEAISAAPEGVGEQSNENCPFCRNEIEKGYMYVLGPGIYWAKKKQLFPKTEHIAGNYSAWTWRSVIEASMCRECRLVLFHGEKMRPATAGASRARN